MSLNDEQRDRESIETLSKLKRHLEKFQEDNAEHLICNKELIDFMEEMAVHIDNKVRFFEGQRYEDGYRM
ncbi:MAG: hypothetical protein ISR65_08470 [Bacteriovoracaceae bacterium]|nr:hypothetical protein [Bacteriovoracaceae bacterium]